MSVNSIAEVPRQVRQFLMDNYSYPVLRVEFHVTIHQKPLPVIIRGSDSSPENADHTLLKILFRPNMPEFTAIHLDLSSTPIDSVDRKLRAEDSACDKPHKKIIMSVGIPGTRNLLHLCIFFEYLLSKIP